MGCAYFLQFLDKFILGQAVLFNLREDLVCYYYFLSILSGPQNNALSAGSNR